MLGCGSYEVAVVARGGASPLVVLPFAQLSYGRKLSATSDAQVGVRGRSALRACCAQLARARPWKHELAVLRDNALVWCGPITRIEIGPDALTMMAVDLSEWVARRRVRADLSHTAADLATIAAAYYADAISADPSIMLSVAGTPTGVTATRAVLAVDSRLAGGEIAELARTGLDWTVVARSLAYGAPSTVLSGVLADDSLAATPQVVLDGSQTATTWNVTGPRGENGPTLTGTASSSGAIAEFGIVDGVAQEDRLADQASADANAANRLALTADVVAVIQEAVLRAASPIPLDQLVPGRLVDIGLRETCVPVQGRYRLQQVDVEAGGDGREKVKISVAPLGQQDDA
jgi:hypothetical protein